VNDRVVAVVAARDEADRIGDTVRALRGIEEIDGVYVADGGSRDGTPDLARAAGAHVLVSGHVAGKGDALEAALSKVPPAPVYLFADADLGRSAEATRHLLDAVREGRADMAVAILPEPPTGGFGLVKRAAGRAIARMTGVEPLEPLSGQRAITAECLRACRPIASGFGVEVGLTVDALRMGFTVLEIPVPLEHRYTRKDLAGFAHRGRQGLDAFRALLPRALAMR
jgi:glucosyl-3-phosphoglycerate synthase